MIDLNIDRDSRLFRIGQQLLLVIFLLLATIAEHISALIAALILFSSYCGPADSIRVNVKNVVFVVTCIFG